MTLEALLQPIAPDQPAGADLLHGPEFDAIEAARREDDPTLPRGVWTAELKRADWPEVARLCGEVLAGRSKDLQVAAWLGEAWIAQDGAAGGARASALVAALCEHFWEGLHPLPRDGDIEFRTAPLRWLDEHWSTALLVRVPLLRAGAAGTFDLSLAGWREALAQENAERKDKKAAAGSAGAAGAAGAVARSQVLAQVRASDLAVLGATLAALDDWMAQLAQLEALLARLLARDAPPLHRLRAAVNEARAVMAGWMGERPDFAPPESIPAALETPPAPDAAQEAPAPAAPEPAALAPIASRADAYARLRQVADYLAFLEPHSPVPLLLRRAVDWGGLPFEKLIAELTHNGNEMQKVLLREPIA